MYGTTTNLQTGVIDVVEEVLTVSSHSQFQIDLKRNMVYENTTSISAFFASSKHGTLLEVVVPVFIEFTNAN